MTYNIPDALAPYLEHIPEDMLSEIITDALEEKIFSKKEAPPVAPAQQVDMNQILEQLQGLLGSSQTQSFGKVIKEQTKVPDTKPIMLTATVDDEEIDDDLKGLVADFAGSMFK